MSFSCARILARSVQHKSFSIQLAHYSRWAHRRAAKVLLPFGDTQSTLKKEKIIDLSETAKSKTSSELKDIPETDKKSEIKNPKKLSKPLRTIAKETSTPNVLTKVSIEVPETSLKEASISSPTNDESNNMKKKKTLPKNQLLVFDENNDFIYEKCKDNDGRISSMLVKLKFKKDRMKMGQVLVEGWRLIVDGLEAKCKLKYILFSRKEDLNNLRPFLPNAGVKIYKIPYKEIEMWSTVDTPSGIIGIFEMPTSDTIKRFDRPLPMQIVCDNIRVPGNLGAILRTATGAGCERVLLTKGCVDIWDPKVLRSGAGAHFRMHIQQGLDWDEITKLVSNDSSVLIADSNTEEQVIEKDGSEGMPMLPYYGIEYSTLKHVTVIIGGETEGISEASYSFAASRNGMRINIPLQKGVDSLNTGMATAVILFEIKKQLRQAWNKDKLDQQTMFGT